MRAAVTEPRKIVPLCIAALFFLTLYINSSPCMVRVVFYPLYRNFKRESFIAGSRDYRTVSTENFRIFSRNLGPGLLKIIRDDAEESLGKVLEDYNYHIEDKINVIVYPEYKEMAKKIGLGSGGTAMGVYFGGIISILDPVKWMDGTGNTREIFKREGPMVHELTHYILDYMAGGNLPIWFTEGAALYEEYRVNDVRWGEDVRYTEYYDIKELENNFYKLDEIKAYKQSFLMVKYIGDNYGMESIVDIAKYLKHGKTIDQALKKVLKITKHDLMERFPQAMKPEGIVFALKPVGATGSAARFSTVSPIKA